MGVDGVLCGMDINPLRAQYGERSKQFRKLPHGLPFGPAPEISGRGGSPKISFGEIFPDFRASRRALPDAPNLRDWIFRIGAEIEQAP
jgi:hypothetical protein